MTKLIPLLLLLAACGVAAHAGDPCANETAATCDAENNRLILECHGGQWRAKELCNGLCSEGVEHVTCAARP